MVKLGAVVLISFLGGKLAACCITYAEALVQLAQETAVIVWDPRNKVEHFVRRAVFEGNAKDFGFIYPSPSQPFRIEVADPQLFGLLESLKHRHAERGGADSDPKSASDSVELLEQKEVGSFEVSVLRASSGQAISDWLKKNGHKMRDAMTPWFDYYAAKGWIFSAFKFIGRGDQTVTEAICISFATETPHYPYKMPSNTFEPNHFREMELFVVSTEEMRGRHVDGSEWPTDREWSYEADEVTKRQLEEFLANGKEPVKLPGNLVVTKFRNSPEATNYGSDLVFEPVRLSVWFYLIPLAVFVLVVAWTIRRKKERIESETAQPAVAGVAAGDASEPQ